MTVRPLNPVALLLCLLAVLSLGYAIVTMTEGAGRRAATAPLAMDFEPTRGLTSVPLPDVPPPPPASPSAMRAMPAAHDGPDVRPSAAPGVAFAYRYAFRLPAARIALVQEQHAGRCEQLGIDRCRIVAMRYGAADDSNVEAMLHLEVEPGIARRFGQTGAALIARADGKLARVEISGDQAGAAINAAASGIAQRSDDLRRLEQRLARAGLTSEERSRLAEEAQQRRASIRAAEADRRDQRQSIARTPIVFHYASGETAPSEPYPPFSASTERALQNFVHGVAILFAIVVTLLPWALVALLGWWIARRVHRALAGAGAHSEARVPSPA